MSELLVRLDRLHESQRQAIASVAGNEDKRTQVAVAAASLQRTLTGDSLSLPEDQQEEVWNFLTSRALLDLAKQEYAKGAKEIPGSVNDQNILDYIHSVTRGPGLAKTWKNPNRPDLSVNDADQKIAWCAAFTNWLQERALGAGHDQMGAKASGSWGKSAGGSVYGAVAVIRYKTGSGEWQYHTGIIAGQSEDGRVLGILGGNQDDQIQLNGYRLGNGLVNKQGDQTYELVGVRVPTSQRVLELDRQLPTLQGLEPGRSTL